MLMSTRQETHQKVSYCEDTLREALRSNIHCACHNASAIAAARFGLKAYKAAHTLSAAAVALLSSTASLLARPSSSLYSSRSASTCLRHQQQMANCGYASPLLGMLVAAQLLVLRRRQATLCLLDPSQCNIFRSTASPIPCACQKPGVQERRDRLVCPVDTPAASSCSKAPCICVSQAHLVDSTSAAAAADDDDSSCCIASI
jgi:hypothetical protein